MDDVLVISKIVDLKNHLSCACDDLIKLNIFRNQNEIDEFIKSHGENFCLFKKSTDDHRSYIYIIPLVMCLHNADCTDRNCTRVHLRNICPFFVFNNCEFREKCKRLHNIHSIHGDTIIKRRRLNSMDSVMLCKLMKLSQTYRIGFCTDGERACSNTECDSLHCCFHKIVKMSCERERCEYGHDLETNYEHNIGVLMKRNLDGVDFDAVIGYLRVAFNGGVSGGAAAGDNQRQQATHKKASICDFSLNNKCKHGDLECRYFHASVAYLWQYLENDCKYWRSFADDMNSKIEIGYCNPNNKKIKLKWLNEEFELNFDTLKTSDDCVRVRAIRRLTTSEAAFGWLWYYASSSGDNEWIEYPNSMLIENAYAKKEQNNELKLASGSRIRFDKMIETSSQGTRKIRRRPRLAQIKSKETNNNIVLPDYWDLADGDVYKRREIPVDSESDEFMHVCDKLKRFLLNSRWLSKLIRLQNYFLLENYNLKKNQMKKRRQNEAMREIYAFHKLNPLTKIDDILDNNLTDGVHFTIDPSKSLSLNREQNCVFILARLAVVVTEAAAGENEICIFDKNQILPLYVVFCKSK